MYVIFVSPKINYINILNKKTLVLKILRKSTLIYSNILGKLLIRFCYYKTHIK